MDLITFSSCTVRRNTLTQWNKDDFVLRRKESFSYITVAWLLNKNDTGSNFLQVHLCWTKKKFTKYCCLELLSNLRCDHAFWHKKLVDVSLSCVKLFNEDLILLAWMIDDEWFALLWYKWPVSTECNRPEYIPLFNV